MPACLLGNFRHKVRIASTIVILNSSVMSAMMALVFPISLSTEPSFPVLSRVVIAKVAMERLVLEINVSISMLQTLTAAGLMDAKLCKIRIAVNLATARGEVK